MTTDPQPAQTDEEPTRRALSVTEYAEIAAHLRFSPRDQAQPILARHELTTEDWKIAAAEWTRAIEAERVSGGHELLLAYADAFVDTERRLATKAAAPEAPSEPPQSAEAEAAEATFQKRAPIIIDVTPAGEPTVMSTAEVNVRELTAALPFASRQPQATDDPHLYPAKARPRLTGTADFDPRAILKAALPFMSKATSSEPSLQTTPHAPTSPSSAQDDAALSGYASLCAELSAFPDRVEATFAKYGVAPHAFEALHAAWRARLDPDPALSERWIALYTRYRDWFASSTPSVDNDGERA